MIDPEHRLLSIALIVTGVAFVLAYPMILLFPASWGWEPHQPEYEQMIAGIYATLGVFTLIAARHPLRHLSLVWFVAVSNLVHGGIMLVQALADAGERANLHGDVPALLVTGALIAVLAPKRLAAA